MKRYRISAEIVFLDERPGDDAKAYQQKIKEDPDGEWVRHADFPVRVICETCKAKYVDTVSVECNCAEMSHDYISSDYKIGWLPKVWICPAHGYKRL